MALISLGCPKNRIDSEYILGALGEAGYVITDEPAEADVTVVNTCGFIGPAKEESIRTILRAAGLKTERPSRKLVVVGCMAQRYGADLVAEIPEIDALAGTEAAGDIVALVDGVLAGEGPAVVGPPADGEGPPAVDSRSRTRPGARLLTTGPATAYLKIAEGCDRRCAFCVIPAIRGPFRSRPKPEILEEAAELAALGVRELILIAQDVTAYGRDLSPKETLPDLIRGLDVIPGIVWIRLLYLHPGQIDAELVEAVAESRHVCRYFDLPMQHASDRILAAMGRGETGAGLLETIGFIRRRIPEAAVRGSFIVGYPGEGEVEFGELLAFLRSARLDHAGFFSFSPEEGTPAALLPRQVPEPVKLGRLARVSRLQRRVARARNEERVGATLSVLVEAGRRGEYPWVGRAEKDAPDIDGLVYMRGGPGEVRAGRFVRARVVGARAYDLLADVVGVEDH